MEEIKQIDIKTLRTVLEAYGVKKRHIQNLVTESIFTKEWKQRSRFSTILEPNNISIEKQIVNRVIMKRNVDITTVNSDLFLSDPTAELLHKNLLEMLTFQVDITDDKD